MNHNITAFVATGEVATARSSRSHIKVSYCESSTIEDCRGLDKWKQKYILFYPVTRSIAR